MNITRLIIDRLNPEELIDILGLTTEQLVILLEDVILDNKEKFEWLDYETETNEDSSAESVGTGGDGC